MKQADIERLLPAVFQRTAHAGSPLAALLAIMESQHAPSQRILDRLAACFDPRRAADELVPYLAGWVDLDWLLEDDDGQAAGSGGRPALADDSGRLRELIALAARLSRWRGTVRGLLLTLETATGAHGFRIEEQPPGDDGRPRPFHFRVHAPAALGRRRRLIERVVAMEKPAYVTFEVSFEAAAQSAPANQKAQKGKGEP